VLLLYEVKDMNLYRNVRSWLYPLITSILAVILVVCLSCQATPPVPSPVPYQATQAATSVAQLVPTFTSTPAQPAPQETPTATPSLATPTSAPSPTSSPAPTSVPLPSMTSPDYGIQAFLWWRQEVATRDLGLIKDMGFRWVKQVFAWSDIEGAKKGHFDWAQADAVVSHANDYGLQVLARLDRAPAWTGAQAPNGPPQRYEDFGDFCYEIASRYRGRIQAYQIWNEPNLAREWGGQPPNPQEYVRLLSIAYQRIKEADPNAIVVSAGLTPTGTSTAEAMPDTQYLDQMYQAGFQNYCDMVGLHAAGFKAPPETSPDEAAANPEYGGERFFCFRHVEDMRQIMETHQDGARRVVILEFGWTSDTIHPAYAWHAVTEEQKAEYMVRAYQWAQEHWRPWIALMSLIYIADSNWKDDREESWWAITAPGYPTPRLRPAYYALRDMPKD
jgi:hypothetical protein